MPKPREDETKKEYLARCIPYMIDNEGKEQDQAVAMCYSFWEQHNKDEGTEMNKTVKKYLTEARKSFADIALEDLFSDIALEIEDSILEMDINCIVTYHQMKDAKCVFIVETHGVRSYEIGKLLMNVVVSGKNKIRYGLQAPMGIFNAPDCYNMTKKYVEKYMSKKSNIKQFLKLTMRRT